MNTRGRIHLILTILAVLYFIPFLGLMHLFDWDEINFAESAREMLKTGDLFRVTIGFEPFWEKPPLFIWLQTASMKLFGINEFAARLPNAVCGIITLNLLYHLGCKIRNHFTGIFWVVAYAGSLAPALYYRSGIIDPVFNLFIFLAVYQLFRSETGHKEKLNVRSHALLTGVFAGLAFLTKGPVALLILFLIWLIRVIINPRHAWAGWVNTSISVLFCLLLASVWILPEYLKSGTRVLEEFINYQAVLFKGQMDWHNQPWFYHILVLLFLCFPASAFSIPQLFNNLEYSGTERTWSAYMRILFWVVLILFSVVSTKIIHYSSLCWFPLGWFAGNALYRWHTKRGYTGLWVKLPVVSISLTIGLACIALGLMVTGNQAFMGWVHKLNNPIVTSVAEQNGINAVGIFAASAVFIAAAVYFLISYNRAKGKHPISVFIFTAVAGMLISAFALPSAENQLQGSYIRELKKQSEAHVFTDVWGFKSYAQFYYGSIKIEDMKGPWVDSSTLPKTVLNPIAQSRQLWLMDRVVDRDVFIFTKFDFKGDWFFYDKFSLVKNLGAYKLWKRKNPGKADIRL